MFGAYFTVAYRPGLAITHTDRTWHSSKTNTDSGTVFCVGCGISLVIGFLVKVRSGQGYIGDR